MIYKHNPALISAARVLRKNMTQEERKLWYMFLKDYPIRFQRQKIIGRFIVDFYCAKAKLVIELDGSQYYEEAGIIRDEERTAFLNGYGLTVVRFSNSEVQQNFKGVCESIDRLVKQATE